MPRPRRTVRRVSPVDPFPRSPVVGPRRAEEGDRRRPHRRRDVHRSGIHSEEKAGGCEGRPQFLQAQRTGEGGAGNRRQRHDTIRLGDLDGIGPGSHHRTDPFPGQIGNDPGHPLVRPAFELPAGSGVDDRIRRAPDSSRPGHFPLRILGRRDPRRRQDVEVAQDCVAVTVRWGRQVSKQPLFAEQTTLGGCHSGPVPCPGKRRKDRPPIPLRKLDSETGATGTDLPEERPFFFPSRNPPGIPPVDVRVPGEHHLRTVIHHGGDRSRRRGGAQGTESRRRQEDVPDVALLEHHDRPDVPPQETIPHPTP